MIKQNGTIRIRQEPPPRCPLHGFMAQNGGAKGGIIYYKCKHPDCKITGQQTENRAYEYFNRNSR